MRKKLLDRISEYLYRQGQRLARTAEEQDGYTLALAIIGAVRHDEPRPFEAACYRAFGSSLERYRQRRAERQWIQHQEFVKLIPDYDPEADKRLDPIQAENRLGNHGQGNYHGQDSSMVEPYRQEAPDANVVQAGEIRGHQESSGRVHQMPSKAQPAVQKPLRSMPRAPKKAVGAG